MPELKCKATNCVYNLDNLCAKSVINVGDIEAVTSNETFCLSFVKRVKMTLEDLKTEFAAFIDPTPKTEINCLSINCLYNDNYVCKAKRVLVSREQAKVSHETNCETFKLY